MLNVPMSPRMVPSLGLAKVEKLLENDYSASAKHEPIKAAASVTTTWLSVHVSAWVQRSSIQGERCAQDWRHWLGCTKGGLLFCAELVGQATRGQRTRWSAPWRL
jgi:hypothetical protein